jgi:predicted O-methyltransferase YrrM
MTRKEIEIMSKLLIKLKPHKILEWGSGYSTLYFSQLFKCKWLAIESNLGWFQKIEKENIYNNIKLKLIVKQVNPDKSDNNPYYDYIHYPTKFKPFDFILVDGLSITRKECLKVARDIISKDGIVVLHDSDRVQYHKIAFDIFKHYIVYSKRDKKLRLTGGLFIATKNKEILNKISSIVLKT